MTVTITGPDTLVYGYGDTETTVTFPLPTRFTYTKGQQSIVDAAIAAGWTLDTTAISNTYGYRFDQLELERRAAYLVQHPFKFVKPATDALGGTWKITLDYASREYSHYGNSGFNKTLKGAKLTRVQADGTESVFPAELSAHATYRAYGQDNTEIVMQPTSTASYSSTNWVWEAALVGEGYSMRERVEALLADPSGIVAKAVSRMEAYKARMAAQEAAREAELAARRRPLPAGWDELKAAAAVVAKANGLTDLGAVLATLKDAVAAVEAVVVH
jgi:hypothetical protein